MYACPAQSAITSFTGAANGDMASIAKEKKQLRCIFVHFQWYFYVNQLKQLH